MLIYENYSPVNLSLFFPRWLIYLTSDGTRSNTTAIPSTGTHSSKDFTLTRKQVRETRTSGNKTKTWLKQSPKSHNKPNLVYKKTKSRSYAPNLGQNEENIFTKGDELFFFCFCFSVQDWLLWILPIPLPTRGSLA